MDTRKPAPAATRVETKDQVVQRLALHTEQLRDLGVKKLALFGSVARGTPTESSDVDLLVDFEPGKKTFDAFMSLSTLLDEVLGRRAEILTRESLSPYLGPHILTAVEDVFAA